jgi:hypothetical protein
MNSGMGSLIQDAVRDLRGTNCKPFTGSGEPLDVALGLRRDSIIRITEESLKSNNPQAAIGLIMSPVAFLGQRTGRVEDST